MQRPHRARRGRPARGLRRRSAACGGGPHFADVNTPRAARMPPGARTRHDRQGPGVWMTRRTVMAERVVTEDQVALAAYFIWFTERQPTGLHEAHWHRARAALEGAGPGSGPGSGAGAEAASAPKPAARQRSARKRKAATAEAPARPRKRD
ncbi:DUF2934 domain-containing protein [Roseicyclus sp.]|uniref:DUF2934 domain-containing protein n=1 Tax=Roseicyclus sp. TaxID=1914329 RepID=UPI003FA0A694